MRFDGTELGKGDDDEEEEKSFFRSITACPATASKSKTRAITNTTFICLQISQKLDGEDAVSGAIFAAVKIGSDTFTALAIRTHQRVSVPLTELSKESRALQAEIS